MATTFVFALTLVLPAVAFGASSEDFEVSGWIPYWRDTQGIKDAKSHISDVDRILPFVFSVQSNGNLKDLSGLDDSNWQRLFKTARSKGVEIVPSVMWSDGASIHTVLSDATLRKNHIDAIVSMVKKGKYDGVDIDYEAKKSETKDFYSLFLKELKEKLGSKLLTCTVEARTPPESLYKEVPKTLNYANDYKAIGTYCDRVEIMGYDQQRADILLNSARTGQPYMPVSDTEWVRKVVALAVQSIPREKIILGIATYGHHYEVTVAPNWYRDYRRIGALNVPDLLEVADDFDVKPSRNAAGEMSFTYLPKSSNVKFPKNLVVPKGTSSGNLVAAKALAYANKTGETITFNMGWYSDAGAINEKIKLAQEYQLAGVALFKIDGEEDKKVWQTLKEL